MDDVLTGQRCRSFSNVIRRRRGREGTPQRCRA
jgi:hypothetical protein